MDSWILFSFTLITISGMVQNPAAWTDSYFTAAVYEHARWGNLTKDPAKLIVENNLEAYKRAAVTAKFKKVDIIVFPEYGIFPPGHLRNDLQDFLEYIPDPKKLRLNPCEEPKFYSSRPILYSLSCMAKEYSLVVVANTGDVQNCTGHSKCPEDGVLHLNTNLAFDKDGTLLAKYHKERLFFEGAMDLPTEEQDPTIQTDFGIFAMFISFDIAFEKVATFARNPAIDAILLTTMWLNYSPFLTSTHYWHSFAIGNNATLLASNIELPGFIASGSGIFNGHDGSFAYTFNPDGISKLVISRVPKRGHRLKSSNSKVLLITKNESRVWNNDGKHMPLKCSWKHLGEANNIFRDYRCIHENMTQYSLVKVTNPKGFVEACSNGMCCSVDYSAESMEESFYLGVFNGTHNFFNRYYWSEENCFFAKCEDVDGIQCDTFPMRSKTVFHRIHMRANFTTNYVYPSVSSSGMRLVPFSRWIYKAPSFNVSIGSIDFESNIGERLLVLSFQGRNYDRDPPYER